MNASLSSFNFDQTAIIRPPEGSVTENRRTTRYVIDSRDRDHALFPTPSSYEIALHDDIDDVLSAELLLADVPFTSYLIHANNNAVAFAYGGANYQALLEIGDYTEGSDVATQLQTALNAAVNAPFTVTFNTRRSHIIITAPQTFALTLTASQANLFGFQKADTTYTATQQPDTSYVLTSAYRINLTSHTYLALAIDSMSVNKSVNKVIDKSFALISKNNLDRSGQRALEAKKHFNPPVAKLSKLRISFYDYDGKPYDFQNQDHRIELLFTSFKHTRRYQFNG